MNWLELIASLVDSISWPILVGLVVYWLRHSIVALAERVSRIKFKDMEAHFKERLGELTPDDAKVAAEESMETAESKTITFMELADISPKTAILEAWIRIEVATRRYTKSLGLGKRLSYQGLRRLPQQHRQKIEHILTPYQELRYLRNQAARSSEFDLTPQVAREYIDVAIWVERVLDDTSREMQSDA